MACDLLGAKPLPQSVLIYHTNRNLRKISRKDFLESASDQIHHDQLTPPPMVDCTPYHDWRATISIIRLDAGINQPLPLPTAHPNPTVTVV